MARNRWKRGGTFVLGTFAFFGIQFAWPNGLQEPLGDPISGGDPPVVTCDPDLVHSTYDVIYNETVRDFVVTTVTLSNIDASGCSGLRVAAVLLDQLGTTLDQTSGADLLLSSAVQAFDLVEGTSLARDASRIVLTIYRSS